jgi:predicted small secreted protein
MMKKYRLVCAAALLLGIGVAGCSNTADGAAKDASQDGQKVAAATNDAVNATKNAADNAADATKKAADATVVATKQAADATVDAGKKAADATVVATKNAADATTAAAKDAGKTATGALEVTPKVKLAILADKDLNDPKNHVNVNTQDGVVHITGSVKDNADKKKAGMIADKTLKDMNATDKVSNELTVGAH